MHSTQDQLKKTKDGNSADDVDAACLKFEELVKIGHATKLTTQPSDLLHEVAITVAKFGSLVHQIPDTDSTQPNETRGC